MPLKLLLLSAILMAAVSACVAPTPPPASPPPAPTQTPAVEPDTRPPEAAPPTTRPPEAAPPTTRPPEAALPSTGFEAIADAAVQFAAAEMNADPASIQVISVDEVEWRNSCLGVDKPGEMCLDVITPGFRVLLDVDGQVVAVHTNQAATAMRLADPAQGLDDRPG